MHHDQSRSPLLLYFGTLQAAALCLTLSSGQASAAAGSTRRVCGERQGTAGEAFLADRAGRTVLELAHQGADQHLLDEVYDRVGRNPSGENGTQVGRRYCLVVRFGADGEPQTILRAQTVVRSVTRRHR